MTGIPFWKRWLSYLTEIHIESAPSEINPHLYVSLKNGRLQLSTAHAVYSYDDLYHNFALVFKKLDLSRLPGEAVLILGFGLGSVPYILEKKLGLQLEYTGIEIDESVIELASSYSIPRLESPVQLIQTSGEMFLDISDETFDLIIIDIFLDDVIPDEYLQIDFLEQVRDHLNPGGLVIMNTLALTAADRTASREFFSGTFKKVFPGAVAETVPGNLMLLSSPAFFK